MNGHFCESFNKLFRGVRFIFLISGNQNFGSYRLFIFSVLVSSTNIYYVGRIHG